MSIVKRLRYALKLPVYVEPSISDILEAEDYARYLHGDLIDLRVDGSRRIIEARVLLPITKKTITAHIDRT